MGLIVRNINFTGNFRGTFPQVPPPPPAPPAPSDQYGAYTVLDLPGTGTNNTNNNVFVDSSANNFAITRVGNTTQGSFSPFSTAPGYWSNYFDGSGDYLTQTTNAAYGYGTGDFTIEFWLNLSSIAEDQTIVSNLTSASSTNPHFYFGSSDKRIYYYTANADRITGNVLSPNNWYHIALSRSSGSTKLFVNGVQSGSTYADTNNYGSTAPLGIGTYWAGDSPFVTKTLNGYISNLRIVKGTALYTTNFTPSTTPLTAVSGTSLLTCQSNRFIDNSSNAFAITRNGNTSVSAFGPYAPVASYNSSTMGGSIYFDGNGDYLNVSNSAALNMEASDFTIECWFYPNMLPSGNTATLFSKRANISTYDGISVGILDSLYPVLVATTNGISWGINSGSSVACVLNAWNHIAITRESNSWKLFVNGQVGITATLSGTVPINTSSYTVGAAAQDGTYVISSSQISNFRIVKGTAVYTTNFTPPTAPVTAISGTSLLLNGTNAAIYDASVKNNLETVGDAKVSTTISAAGSMYFDGSGDRLVVNDNKLSIGTWWTGDYTVEYWVYGNVWSAGTFGHSTVFSQNDSGPTEWWSFGPITGGTVRFYWWSGSPNNLNTGSGLSTGAWHHLAFTKSGSTLRIFINGAIAATTTLSNTPISSSSTPIMIGSGGGEVGFNGYINNLRVTKGIARYTANFTPPARS